MRALAVCKQRIGIVPGQAVHPAWPVVLEAAPHRLHTISQQRTGDHIPDKAAERLAFKAEFKRLRPVDPLPGLCGQAAFHAVSSSPHK